MGKEPKLLSCDSTPLQGFDNSAHDEDEVNFGYGYTANVLSFFGGCEFFVKMAISASF